jgi:hypothetical protein
MERAIEQNVALSSGKKTDGARFLQTLIIAGVSQCGLARQSSGAVCHDAAVFSTDWADGRTAMYMTSFA